MVYAGTLAMEDMGFKTIGLTFGRADECESEEVNWGSEGEWLGDKRHTGDRVPNKAFVVDMSTDWKKASTEGLYEGRDRATGKVKWTATPVDLVFGSNSELRSIALFYASDDSRQKFAEDFAKA